MHRLSAPAFIAAVFALLLVAGVFLSEASLSRVEEGPEEHFLQFTTPNGYSTKQKAVNYFLSFFAAQLNADVVNEKGEKHHGSRCVACVLVVGQMERLAVVNSESIEKAVSSYCKYLPEPLATPCSAFVNAYGKQIIEALEAKETADVACRQTGICWDPKCHLYPDPKSSSASLRKGTPAPALEDDDGTMKVDSIWDDILNKFKEVFERHTPLEDFDDDNFSLAFPLRGTAWRGRDCNDLSRQVYPGRRVNTVSPSVDHNCNGIYGLNSAGKSYEEDLCANSEQRGTVILGDSASAHFRIPDMWVNATAFKPEQLKPAAGILENEMDWPHLSWATGHMNDTTGLTPGPVDSIYMRMVERNRCNHRDYQNIGVNGARSSSLRTISQTMARNQKYDHPAVVFYAPIGNDVCSGHENYGHMTTPSDFYDHVMTTMNWLDTVLPSESHVIFIGLVDGRFLWDHLHNREHPIGVKYPDVYDFLTCYHVNPCWGWLNRNETVRDFTSNRAAQLSDTYQKVMGHSFKNFKTYYHPFPLQQITDIWVKNGGQAYELIEPVDGFHPSQIANALLGQYLFEAIDKNHPEVFGPVNPNNDKIKELFGDQGGY